MCSIAILSLQLTTISFSRTYSSLRNERLCGKWTSPLINVISCPSPLNVSHRHSPTRCVTPPLEGVMFQKYLGVYITNSLNWTKQAVEVKKKVNKILGVGSKGKYRLVELLSRNEPICPWSALYASTAPSPGVHIHKRTFSPRSMAVLSSRAQERRNRELAVSLPSPAVIT